MVFILFGLPGAGKTFAGNIFKEYFGYHFYDGDSELTEEMKQAINTKSPVTEEMRDLFFQKIIMRLKELKEKYPCVVLAQTFIKEKYRKAVLEEIKETEFILVRSDEVIREARLLNRKEYPLDIGYAKSMCVNFEAPGIYHKVIVNDREGKESVKSQIELLRFNLVKS